MRWLALAVMFVPSVAHACFEPAVGPRSALSARIPAFFAHGAALYYERFLPTEASVGFGLSARATAGGDYSSTTIVATTEARWWPIGAGPFGCRGRYEMIGLFLGARLDVGATNVRDRVDDRSIGTAWTIAPSTWLGWRFAFGHLELSPAAATMVRHERGGGLHGYTTVTFAYDLTAGWMF